MEFLNKVKDKAVTTNPVFGKVTLQKATFIVSILNLTLACLMILGMIFFGGRPTKEVKVVTEKPPTYDGDEIDGDDTINPLPPRTEMKLSVTAMLMYIFMYALLLFILGLNILLFLGAKKKDYAKCRLWFLAMGGFVLILEPITFLVLLNTDDTGGLLRQFIRVVLSLYEMWIVYAFMFEVNPNNLPHIQLDSAEFTKGPSTENFQIQDQQQSFSQEQETNVNTYNQQNNYGWND